MSDTPVARTAARSLRWDLLVNVAGTGWGAVVQLACIPVYLALLGAEGYGLIAFATTLQLTLKALDFGLSHSINRELAARVANGRAAGSRELVRTLEVAYGMFGAALGLAIAATAPLMTSHWFGASTMPASTITFVLRLIAVLVAVQWPLTLYQGALLGLGRAAAMNAAAMVAASAAGGGAVLLLLSGHRSLQAFFAWQAFVAAAHTLVTFTLVHRALAHDPSAARARYSLLAELRSTLTGVGALALSFLLLTQSDKLLASRWLQLADYGHYMIGAAVASGLAVLGAPVFNTLLPRLSALAQGGDEAALRAEFSRGTRLLMILVFPVMLALAVLSRDVLWLWTRDAGVAMAASTAASALLAGTGVATLLQLLMALQVATGRTRAGTRINLALVVVLVVAGAVAARSGAQGVAIAWAAIVFTGAVTTAMLAYHHQVGEGPGGWLLRDVGWPLFAMAAAVFALSPILTGPLSAPLATARILGFVVVLGAVSASACGLASGPRSRDADALTGSGAPERQPR